MKLKLNDTSEKDEKITTNYEPSDNENVVDKTYQDKELSKAERHISFMVKEYKVIGF